MISLPCGRRLESGLVPDLRLAIAQFGKRRTKQSGIAMLFDMDHTEGTYAAAEFPDTTFERVEATASGHAAGNAV